MLRQLKQLIPDFVARFIYKSLLHSPFSILSPEPFIEGYFSITIQQPACLCPFHFYDFLLCKSLENSIRLSLLECGFIILLVCLIRLLGFCYSYCTVLKCSLRGALIYQCVHMIIPLFVGLLKFVV